MKFKIILYIFIILLSCKESQKINEEELETTDIASEEIFVSAVPIRTETFYKELVSNGKLVPTKIAELKFQAQSVIEKIYVANGEFVEYGKLVATQNNIEQTNQLQRAKTQLEKAKLNLEDVLLSLGYSMKDSLSIPEKIYNSAHIKSGYNEAINEMETATYIVNQTVLKAPISGRITNLTAKENTYPKTTTPFCTIVDDRQFEVEFFLLEEEINLVKISQSVEITPASDANTRITGKIVEINPTINENGQAMVKAEVENKSGILLSGMNVTVSLKIPLANKLVVPKEAVVLRQGKKVVFTYENGRAIWKYVTPGLENSEYITIEEGLEPNDSVIIEGNLNLGHEAEVTLQ